METYADLMITPSEVMEYLYCPRFTFFLNVLKIPQYEEKRYKVQKGRIVHEQRLKHNKDYLRKKIPMIKKDMNVYLASEKIHVRGIVDEIAYMRDGTLSPIDYKFSLYKDWVFKTHKIQTALYGMMISEKYNMDVRQGYIFYIRNGSKMNIVNITPALCREATNTVLDILYIISKEEIPRKTKYKIRCFDCCYKNICV